MMKSMAGTNDFKPFAVDPQANLVSQEVWDGAALRPMGNVQGSIANSALVNKALRQGTTAAALLGGLIASHDLDARDDADLEALLENLNTALGKLVQTTGGVAPTGGATGQVLTKTGDEDYALGWAEAQTGLPQGGGTGQILTKKSDADYDVGWSGQGNTLNVIQKDVVNLGNTVGEILMALEALELYPEYQNMLIEDFKERITLDQFNASVLQATAGAAFLVVSPVSGIIPNTRYHISDSLNEEDVMITGVNNTNGNYRLALAAPLIHTYQTPGAVLTRMDAHVQDGQVVGPSRDSAITWSPGITWTGTTADTPYEVVPVVNVGNTQSYVVNGDIAIGENGLVTLEVS
jgi:hypothetical protein